jgi:hypothetical protein
VDDDFAELSALMGTIAGSPVNWELSVRLHQSLEITDGLWELVPVVVGSGAAIDARPAAELADMSPAARDLDDATRARVRDLADAYVAMLDTAFGAHPVDEAALASITPAEMMANPFGIAGAMIDMKASSAHSPSTETRSTCSHASRVSMAIRKSGWVVWFSPGRRPPVFQAGGRVFSRRGGG